MPLDSIYKKVEHSTFLGNFQNDNDKEDDDILIKFETEIDSLGFVIFSKTGQMRKLQDNIDPNICKSLKDFKVV
jgi:hypothetical protein